MKGLFFTELLELIEADYGLNVADCVIRIAVPSTDGVFTSMDNYDAEVFFGLIAALSIQMNQPCSTFLRSFGRHCFRCLLDRNEQLLDKYPSAIKAIKNTNRLVAATRIFSFEHQPPTAEFVEVGPAEWQLIVRSKLPVQEMILGALEACIACYGEPLEIKRTDVQTGNETTTRFDITPKAASCLTTYK